MKIDIQLKKSARADLNASAEIASPVIKLSLANHIGMDGKSAYEVALENGFTGTREEWLESLSRLSTEADTIAHKALASAQTASGKADTALTSAQNAEKAVSAISTAAQRAEQAAESAATAAQNAGQASETAATTAQNAKQASETATTASQRAEQAAETATVTAQSAGQTAESAFTKADEALQKVSSATSSAESALSAAADAARDAGNAVAAAVAAADAATEAQEQAVEAWGAASYASEATSAFEAEIDRIYETLYFELQNIGNGSGNEEETSPKNTGVAMYGGYYQMSTASPMVLTGNLSAEVFFTTSDDITTTQIFLTLGTSQNFQISNKKLIFATGLSTILELNPELQPNSSYHFILTFDISIKTISFFLNGAFKTSKAVSSWSNSINSFRLGKGSAFSGVVHHCRFFTDVLPDATIEALWNNGSPQTYELPRSMVEVNGGICKAEFIPEGIADGYWSDNSGNSYDYLVTGSVTPSQIIPDEFGPVSLSTGPITQTGTVQATIAIPDGYRIDELTFTSANTSAMSGVSVVNGNDSSVFFSKDSLPAGASYLYNPSAAGYIYAHGNNTLVVSASGNTAKGCRLDAKAVWFKVR